MHERTEGNPFFLEEVYRHLRDLGRLDAGTGSDEPIPEGVRSVIRRRVDRLPASAGRLLTCAAVAGRVLPFPLLVDLAGTGEAETLDAVDAARRAVLLMDCGADLMFTHELVRQALVADLSGPRRELMHRQAADAKARLHAANLDEHAAEIVHHLSAAGGHGCPTTLGRMQYRAGRRALDIASYPEAVAHLEAATDLCADWAAADRGELFHRLGDAQQRVGRIDDALRTWDLATESFTEAGDVEAIGQVCHLASLALAWAGRMEESVASYQRGLTALGERVSPTRVRILASFAGALGSETPPRSTLTTARRWFSRSASGTTRCSASCTASGASA